MSRTHTHTRRCTHSFSEWFKFGVNSKQPLCQDSLASPHTVNTNDINDTKCHYGNLEPLAQSHTPLYNRKAREKARQGWRKRAKVGKIRGREPKEGVGEWESEKMKRGKTGVSQNVSGRKRASGWVQGYWSLWSWWGARAECLVWKQAEQCATAKPEIQLCRKRAPFFNTPHHHPAYLHSHLPPSAYITPSITLSVPPPDRLS